MSLKHKLMDLARQFGVVGAGGAGFPTHVKLNAKVDYLVINGAECEPLMTVDQLLMQRYPEQLAETLHTLRRELDAKEVIIGIKAKHKGIIEVLEQAVRTFDRIRVAPLGDFYPAGDEYVLVYETTGRQIPQGGIPLECGVVVINVETLWNLWQGVEGKAVTHKWVTVAGKVNRPGVYRVPLGISISEMLTLAGGSTIEEYSVVNGGPMMGKLVHDLQEPVTKTTKGLLVLPNDSPVIVNQLISLERIIRQAQSVCCQCQICTDLCPRNLLGYKIHPNKTILAAGYQWSARTGGILGAMLCSECGACDMYACSMGLSPRRINQMLKSLLVNERVSSPNKGALVQASEWRPYRRIPTKRLIKRLGLLEYHSPVQWIDNSYEPNQVVLYLRQHIGVSSKPIVHVGEIVELGQQVAAIPDGMLGGNLFASLTGRVTEVTDTYIAIQKM